MSYVDWPTMLKTLNLWRKDKMKITKNQLRKIIKEEQAKLQKKQLKESVTDMRHYEDMIEDAAFNISERFMSDMGSMYEEEPEAFSQSVQEWNKETLNASSDLERRISLAVAQAVQAVEQDLHDGQYSTR